MSAVCRFCGQEYANAQAVRAHLKGCAAYRARPGNSLAEDGSLGNGKRLQLPLRREFGCDEPRSHEAAFDPVRQLRQQLEAERIRLQLREVEDAHAERNRAKEAKERERLQQVEQEVAAKRAASEERERARLLAEESHRQRERRQTEEAERTRQRREIIQIVKQRVVEHWFPPIWNRPDLKARALEEIERKLFTLPVEDLPVPELVLSAETVRDAIYREAMATEQRSQQLAKQRLELIELGCRYASEELRDAEGLDVFGRWKVEKRVREELQSVQGDEARAEIEDWVEEILDAEGIDWDEDDEDEDD